MRYYKLVNGLETAMTSEEIQERKSDEQATVSKKTSQLLKENAIDALEKSDMVAMRCFKAGVAFPKEWLSYVTFLRGVMNGSISTLPQQPDYPKGS